MTNEENMNHKIVLLLFCLAFYTTSIFSQQVNIDSVFLNNGNLITGKIIQSAENEFIKIKTTNGNYFFGWSDISFVRNNSHVSKLTNDSLELQNISSLQTRQDTLLKTSNTLKLKSINQPIYIQQNAELPYHIFQLKAGIGIENYKFRVLYGYRFWSNISLGVGYEYTNFYNDFSGVYDNLIFDVKFLNKTTSNNLSCFAIDFGVGVYKRYGLEVGPLLMINPSYIYGLRISRNFFLTAGIDLCVYKNLYIFNTKQDAVTFGVVMGVLF